jgi:magnesium transporter
MCRSAKIYRAAQYSSRQGRPGRTISPSACPERVRPLARNEPVQLPRAAAVGTDPEPGDNGTVIVDCALYTDGERQTVSGPAEAIKRARTGPDSFVWIGLYEPTYDEFDDLALYFTPHPLAVEDMVNAHQRPKLEIYDDSLFMVLKTLRYVEESSQIESGEVMFFTGDRFVVTIRHGEGNPLGPVRRRLERQREVLRYGPSAVLYAICDAVVDTYEMVAAEVERDLEAVEAEVFAAKFDNDAMRIYTLKREVLEFRHACMPLAHPMSVLATGRLTGIHPETGPFFRDVADHVTRVIEKVEGFDALLTDILTVNLAQISVRQNEQMHQQNDQMHRQNEDMRRISAWVAIVAVNTVIAGIYGMNFDNMPELHTRYGYFVTLGAMAVIAVVLYRLFRRSGWL